MVASKPLNGQPPPAIKDPWIGNPIDAFILATLQKQGLQPSPQADRVSLIRRVYLDLIGLPPTAEQIEQFVADTDPGAYEHMVDELLDSPRYGERWARHWLDVIRFAETDGFEMNTERPNAYRFRDYLIRALNEDRPWDQMIVDQLAGDASGEDAATGFIVGGPVDRVKSPNVLLSRTQRQDELADMISTTSTAFLGLTVGCAKCHDHKFDPIPQRDFYSFQAVFAGVEHQEREVRISDPEDKSPAGKSYRVYAGGFVQPGPSYRLYRGDPMQPREQVVAEGLTALRPLIGSLDLKADSPEQARRLALARWIAQPKNPLTARVIVNRLWHYHFGTGIVASPSDFGRMGTPPTHPELLDWLAGELVREGWRLKTPIHPLDSSSPTPIVRRRTPAIRARPGRRRRMPLAVALSSAPHRGGGDPRFDPAEQRRARSDDVRARLQCLRAQQQLRAALRAQGKMGTGRVATDGLHDQGSPRAGSRVRRVRRSGCRPGMPQAQPLDNAATSVQHAQQQLS